MIRHALASAALVAVTLVTTDAFIGHGFFGEPELAAGYGPGEDEEPPPRPGRGIPSSQRPPSDRSGAASVEPPTIRPPSPIEPGQRLPSDTGNQSPVPPNAREMFVGDFETGDFSQWETCQTVAMNSGCDGYDSSDYSLNLVKGRQGSYAAKFVVRPGDVPDFGGGERSEVSADQQSALTHEGDERWYEFSLRFAEDFPDPVEGSWFIVMQWHPGDESPPLTIEVNPEGELYVGGEGHEPQVIGPVRRGEWVDYALHAGFSNSSDGFVEAWENGEQTVKRINRATMSSDENYFKMGIYRGNDDDTTAEVCIDGLRISEP